MSETTLDVAAVQRRTVWVLSGGQVLGGLAFGATLPAQLADGVRALTVSAADRAEADIAARDIMLDADGLAFSLRIDGAWHPVRSPLLGRFNVDNLLVAAGVLLALGQGAADIARVLGTLQPIPSVEPQASKAAQVAAASPSWRAWAAASPSSSSSMAKASFAP